MAGRGRRAGLGRWSALPGSLSSHQPAARKVETERAEEQLVTHTVILLAHPHTHTHDTDTKVEANKRRRIQARTRPL